MDLWEGRGKWKEIMRISAEAEGPNGTIRRNCIVINIKFAISDNNFLCTVLLLPKLLYKRVLHQCHGTAKIVPWFLVEINVGHYVL